MSKEKSPPIKPVEPGIAFCRCGLRMQDKASRRQEHVGVPADENFHRLRQEGDIGREKTREALGAYDVFESWYLIDKRIECGTLLSGFKVQFTGEEAHACVACSGMA